MRAQIEDPYEHMTKLEMIQSLRERGGGGGARTDDQVTQLQVSRRHEYVCGWADTDTAYSLPSESYM